jgi:hypothetical protein
MKSNPQIGRNIAELQKSPKYLLRNGATTNINTTLEIKISTNPSSNEALNILRSARLRDKYFSDMSPSKGDSIHLHKKYFVLQSTCQIVAFFVSPVKHCSV